jgi:hypothetical protein
MAGRNIVWSGMGVVLAAGASLALPACSPAGGEAGHSAAVGEAAVGESGGEAGAKAAPAAPIGESGGEAGAQSAYDGLSPEVAAALRVRQLEGFALIAQKALEAGATPAEASVLISQGLLEVARPAEAQFAAGASGELRRALEETVATLDAGGERAKAGAAFAAAQAAADKAAAGADPKAIVSGLLKIATGIYAGVVKDGAVDPIEYQHSLGAALAAQAALADAESALGARDAARYAQAKADLAALIALWPAPSAPETATPLSTLQAAESRVELSLSGL